MENNAKETENRSSARQTGVLIGVALIVLSAIFVYIAVSQPKIHDKSQNSETSYTEGYEENESSESVESKDGEENKNIGFYTENTTRKTAEISSRQENTVQAVGEVKYPLDLNTCTAEELMTIDGVGGTRAAAIISYREYLGGYTSVEQLKDISGIGDKTFEKIAPYVIVR